jgi:pimeloyl-ACP methyl ester carboxylesterase
VPFARADDKVRIYYEARGHGTPLVLAYGIGGNAEMWDVNREALAARHRLILWEPRGHARSGCPEDPAKYSFQRWALDLRAVLDHLAIRKAHVGMDAMAEYAMAANPNVSERLALEPAARAEFYEEYRRLSPIGYANSLRALIAMDYITDQLPRLRMPVLLIGGDRDPSLEPMKVMHRKVRGSRLVVLSPASHFSNRDQPEAWNRTVLEFLARCDRRARG